jgi:hypothetical protein
MKTLTRNFKKFALLLTLVLGLSAIVSAKSKIPVKVTDLQKNITSKITKDYAGYTIKNAYKVNENKVITYDVNVVKGNQTLCLAFDKNGNFLKVIEPKKNTNQKTSMNSSNTGTNKKSNSKAQHL